MRPEGGLEVEVVSTEREGLLAEPRLRIELLCRRGASDASCRTVDTRCIRGGSGEFARKELMDDACEAILRGTMNPYRSTSPPWRSSQSSIPPASSLASRTKALSLLLYAEPVCDGTRSDATPFVRISGTSLDCDADLDPL